jgi:hypothetical protein
VARSQTRSNPFYVVLVIVGIFFAITAFAYCVMAFRAVRPADVGFTSESGQWLMQLLDKHGMWIMLGQIVVLAVATFGAITTDDFWTKQATGRKPEPDSSSPPTSP